MVNLSLVKCLLVRSKEKFHWKRDVRASRQCYRHGYTWFDSGYPLFQARFFAHRRQHKEKPAGSKVDGDGNDE
jgi:hypothetical protein